MNSIKRLVLIKCVDGKSHNYTTYKVSIKDDDKTFQIVTNKKKGTQDLIEVLHTSQGNEYLSYLLEDATNKEIVQYLYNNFKYVI